MKINDPFSAPPDDSEDDSGSPRQEPAERFLLLLRLLTANSCTRKEIFEQLSIPYKIDDSSEQARVTSQRSAQRTLERDLECLSELGYEITKTPTIEDKRVIRYRAVPGSGPNTQFLFSQDELEALIIIYKLFTHPAKNAHPHPEQSPRHPFSDVVLRLIERFKAILPEKQRAHFDQSVQKSSLYFNINPVADYLPHQVIINSIITMIDMRQSISFLYASSRGKKSPILHEHVDPYYISHIDGHFYLIGYSYKMQTFFEYRIDRIIKESLKPRHDTIDRVRQQRPIVFRYWADKDLVHSGLSQRWLSQSIEREEEYIDETNHKRCRFLVRASAYSEWRILQQLRKYASKVELIEPQRLREQMHRELLRTIRLYQQQGQSIS